MTAATARQVRRTTGIALLILAALRLSAAPSTQLAEQVAYVTVLDRQQSPVDGLTAADLTIRENGRGLEIVSVAPATEPLAIGVLVDTAQPDLGTFSATRDIRRALTTFVGRLQAADPASRIAIMETGGAAVMTQAFSNSGDDLSRSILNLYQSQRSSSVVLEGLQAMGTALSELRETRRAIVSIDFDSPDTSRVQPDTFASRVQLAGASVIAVSVRTETNRAPGRNGVLAWITDVTGGMRLTGIVSSALEGQLETVARALTSQYRVVYRRPTGTPLGELRGSSKRGGKVHVTRSYSR
jgi:hypothetical protein